MTCTTCGAGVEATWTFCERCGSSLAGATETAQVTGARLNGAVAPRQVALTQSDAGRPVSLLDDHPADMPDALTLPIPSGGAHDIMPQPDPGPEAVAPAADVAVPAATTVLAASWPTPARRHWSGRQVAAAGAVVLLLGIAVWQGVLAHGRGNALSRTRHQLASTRSTLASTRGELSTTQNQLGDAQKQITTLNGQIDDLNGQLGDTRTQLKGAQNTVNLQGQQITNLRTCLDGVASALSDLANGYTYIALSDLQSVSGACDAARGGIG